MTKQIRSVSKSGKLASAARSTFEPKAVSLSNFERVILDEENRICKKLDVRNNLQNLVALPGGCQAFAEAFYFVRYGFYRLNFIVGARSGPDEVFWSGLVYNLYEELGGLGGKSHNELYRNFLGEVGINSESELTQPSFASRFNEKWEGYCSTAPFEEALAGVAIYEVLDQPDYALLYGVLKEIGISKKGLRFFEVHAQAQHFDLFQGIVGHLWKNKRGQEILSRAATFVSTSQREMWTGLLSHLELVVRARFRTV